MADHSRPGRGAPAGWPDADLERALRDLGRDLAYPATPDLAAAVRSRLAGLPTDGRHPPPGWRDRAAGWFAGLTPLRTAAVAVLAVVLAGVLLLAVLPGARDTVAGWFGVRGIRIVFVERIDTPTPAPTSTLAVRPGASPAPTPRSLGGSLLLGDRVTLAEAQAQFSFPLRLPDAALLGPPDEVYLRRVADGLMVSYVYYPRPKLPAAAETGVGLLLVQIEGESGDFWLEKGVAPANERAVVVVNNEDALWLGGAHYLLVAPDPTLNGRGGQPESRIAGNVLLWDEGGVTFRLESGLSAPEAVMLAESLLPMATPVPSGVGTAPATPTAEPSG